MLSLPVLAQRYPERGLVRKGNRAFENEKYDRSIDRYRTALEHNPESREALYNLGNALYRTGQLDSAMVALRRVAADTLLSAADRSAAYFNLGCAQFDKQSLQESLESFKSVLRLTPEDQDAKYNYTFVKRLLQNQDQNQDQQQNQEQQDQEQQQNQEQQNQDQQNQNQDQQNQEQQNNQNPEEPQQEQPIEPKPVEGRISEQEQEQMLEAIQAQEDETQERLKEREGVIIRGSKNW